MIESSYVLIDDVPSHIQFRYNELANSLKSSREERDGLREEAREQNYNFAMTLLNEGRYEEAMMQFLALGDFRNSAIMVQEIQERMLNLSARLQMSSTFSAGNTHSIAILDGGKVRALHHDLNPDTNFGQDEVLQWEGLDIVSVSAGGTFSAGLLRNGDVVVAGTILGIRHPQIEWNNIIAISAGYEFLVGLMPDNTVVALGVDRNGQTNVDGYDWNDIVAISTGIRHTAGLRADGTVVIAGHNAQQQQRDLNAMLISDNPVVSISAGGGFYQQDEEYYFPTYGHTVVLFKDGTVFAVGDNSLGQLEVANWYDVVAICAGGWHTIGLRGDGRVVTTTFPSYDAAREHGVYYFHGDFRTVDEWQNITDLSAGTGFTVVLSDDGTLLTNGFGRSRRHPEFQGYQIQRFHEIE